MIALLLLLSVSQPAVSNGTLVERAASAGLDRAIRDAAAEAKGVAWVGYEVPAIPGERHMCRDNERGGTMRLEPSGTVFVLLRLSQGQVERVRLSSDECRIDAGGRTLFWLTGVRPAESVSYLASLASGPASRRVADGVMSALALHAEPAALDRLLTVARSGEAPHARGQALFWLSQRAGQRAVGAISDAIETDPDTDVKKRAVFALSQLPRDEGVPLLIQVARTHSNQAVRKQAFFWLGQSKDPRALEFFAEVLRR